MIWSRDSWTQMQYYIQRLGQGGGAVTVNQRDISYHTQAHIESEQEVLFLHLSVGRAV